MKNLSEIRKIIYGCISTLAVIQILLGIFWIIFNFSGLQNFRETKELLEIAESMVTDEYTGILYPLLIKGALFLEKIFSVPYYCCLYAAQLILGFTAIYKVLDHFPRRTWITFAVMTIPVVCQFYLAVLPQSMAVSALLLCFYYCGRDSRLKGAVCWLAAGLLIPEYFFFGAVLFVGQTIAGAVSKKEKRRKILTEGITGILLVCISAGTIGSLTVQCHSRGRMARTPAAMALHRTVWPDFATYQYFWNSLVQEAVSEDDLIETARNPDKVYSLFGIKMEEAYGVKEVQATYWQMAETALRVGTKEIIGGILNDFLEYSIPPAALGANLKGIGVSFSGWNYGRMAERAPMLTRWYVIYSSNAFLPVLLLVLLYWLSGEKRKEGVKEIRLRSVWLAAVSLLFVLWYTFSASGMQDYKNVVFVSVSWGICMAHLSAGHTESKET